MCACHMIDRLRQRLHTYVEYDRLLIGVKEPKDPNKSYLNFTLDDLEMIMNITDTNGGPLESTSRTLHLRLTTVTGHYER